MWATRALASSVLVGMQPVLTQVPPKSLRSTSATLSPALASSTASGGPAWPAPSTIASKCVAVAVTSKYLLPGCEEFARHVRGGPVVDVDLLIHAAHCRSGDAAGQLRQRCLQSREALQRVVANG